MRLPAYLASNELTSLGRKTLLDRYAKKAPKTTPLELGDLVIICTDKDTGQREIGEIVGLSLDGRSVQVKSENGGEHTVDSEEVDKPIETDPQEVVSRVAKALSKVEEKPRKWENTFRKLMNNWAFVPGGRILMGAGIQDETPLTWFNCNVIPAPKDSRQGILDTAAVMAELFSRGAGVGTHLSSLRPRFAYVKGVNGRSSGAVSWGSLYSHLTGLIEQGGCVVGETLVATDKGNIPIQDLVGTKPWVYTYDLEEEKVCLKQASWVGKTGSDKKLIRFETDKGLSLTATPDHLIMCRDGEYRPVNNLTLGMRIMPLRRFVSRKKEAMVQTVLGDRAKKEVYSSDIPLHRFIYANAHDISLTPADLIHHKDENHENNSLSNLELLTTSEHPRLHGKKAAEQEDFALRNYWKEQSPERRKVNSEQANAALLAGLRGEKGIDQQAWLKERISHKARTDNAMQDPVAKLKAQRNSVIGVAFKLINNGISIETGESWDQALYANRVTRSKKKYGLGCVSNMCPRSAKIRKLFGSHEQFLDVVTSSNHKIVSISYVDNADVYDLEVPDTHNFAVVDSKDITSSGIFIHNSRRGASMLVLHVWHPDIEEFIECKREPKAKQLALLADKLEYGMGLTEYAEEARDLAGSWPTQIQHANLSVGITDDFMEAVIHDRDWQLIFPDTSAPEYTETWDGDIQTWQDEGKPVKVHKIVKARDLWNKMMFSAWDSGEPGVIYIDTVNSESTSWWYCKILATNPCITGDTKIAVADGRQSVSIKQLAEEGKDVPVFCTTKEGGWRVRWGRQPRLTKTNAEVWKVTLDDGSTVRATPDHKFMLRDGSSCKLKDLTPGSRLMPFVKGRYSANNRDDWWINSTNGHHGIDREARVVAEFVEGRWPKAFPSEVVHHKDEDHWNNSYKNIEIKGNKKHSFDHSSGESNPMYGRTQSEETKATIGAKTVERFQDDSFRKKHSEAVSRSMQNNPNVGRYERTPEIRRKLSEANLGNVPSEETKTKRLETRKRNLENKGVVYKTVVCPFCNKEQQRLVSNQTSPTPYSDCCSQKCRNTLLTGKTSSQRQGEGMSAWARTEEGKVAKIAAAKAAACSKALKQGKWILDTYGDIDSALWEEQRQAYRKDTGSYHSIQSKKIVELFGNWESFTEQATCSNHKVISVGFDCYEDVYNITVDEHHTYAIVTNDNYLPQGAKFVKQGGIASFNCGEQPLPSWYGICNLGALNLPRFLMEDPENQNKIVLDKDSYKNAIHTAIRFLDNVIDSTPYFFDEQKIGAKRERRVGLSPFMGLAEAFVILGIRYGSEESLDYIEEIGYLAASEALKASILLAEEKGCCEVLATEDSRKKFIESRFIQRVLRFMDKEDREHCVASILEFGVRNMSLLTSAPTGTIGTMVATSTGIEPFFLYEYTHRTNLGVHVKRERVLEEWHKQHGEDAVVPEYFVSTADLTPQEHVKTQAALQRWIDSGISKTHNLPNTATVEEVGGVYMDMWKRRCKGGTVFRDGSRTLQVLESLDKKPKQLENFSFPERVVNPSEDDERDGKTISIKSPGGTLHSTLNVLDDVSPFESFLRIGKAGSDVSSMTEAFGRVISLFLQLRGPISPTRRCELLVEQLEGIGGRDQVGFGPNRVRSIPDAVARAFTRHLSALNPPDPEAIGRPSSMPPQGLDMCPECGNIGLRSEEGCTSCAFCGYSKC